MDITIGQLIECDYTDLGGKTTRCRLRPETIAFDIFPFGDPEPQWIMHALDIATNKYNHYLMKNIKDVNEMRFLKPIVLPSGQ